MFLFCQYWFSDKIALFGMHGHIVTPEQEPELHGIVDRLCALADMPKPRVAVAEVDMPNAFATGRNPTNAVVCATRGIMRRLDEPELEAVLAHELSHVAHRDVAMMTIASFLGMVAGLITRFTLYAGLFGGFGGAGTTTASGSRAGRHGRAGRASSSPPLIYAISFLLTMALSRYRELAADRSGAILIGRPSLLASALVKVTGEMQPDPHPRPALGRALQRLLLHSRPRQRRQPVLAVLHPPAAAEAPRPAGQARGRDEPGPDDPTRRIRHAREAALMGLFDTLLGRTKPVRANLDALFALPSAAVTLQVTAGLVPTGQAGVCFKPPAGQPFADMQAELEQLLERTPRRSPAPGQRRLAGATAAHLRTRWCATWVTSSGTGGSWSRAATVDDLVTRVHMVHSSLAGRRMEHAAAVLGLRLRPRHRAGHGSATEAGAPDASGRRPSHHRPLYLVYLAKQGTFYPFAPTGDEQRDTELELRLKGMLGPRPPHRARPVPVVPHVGPAHRLTPAPPTPAARRPRHRRDQPDRCVGVPGRRSGVEGLERARTRSRRRARGRGCSWRSSARCSAPVMAPAPSNTQRAAPAPRPS